ncbi:MAG: zinc-binding alcohol dehydrogenase, partial [Halobacteriales archaeon]
MDRRTLYFTDPGSVELRETTVPEPTGNQLLVETRASAVSPGTERLIYRGEAPTELPADETIDALSGDLSFPLSYGYAAAGEVVASGESVDGDWSGTDVFAFVPHQSAFLSTPDDVVALPPDVDVETATLLPTVETATNLVLDGRPRLGERVVVFGAGAVGLATLHLLAAFPLERLVAVEPVPARRELARRFGADAAVSPEPVRDGADGLTAGIDSAGPGGDDESTTGAQAESAPADGDEPRATPDQADGDEPRATSDQAHGDEP